MYDFANILFSGPCNQRCPYCVGHEVRTELRRNNLTAFPIPGIDRFIDLVNTYTIPNVILTGTDSDPLLYKYDRELVHLLRQRLHSNAQLSVHTNGVLALTKIQVLNMCDRVSISFPSFNQKTFYKMTGTRNMPDLAEIVRQSRVPVKVSCVVDRHNAGEILEFMDRLISIGVRRLAFRKLFRAQHDLISLDHLPIITVYRQNPVYSYKGLEVAYWDFDRASSTSINLFGDGTISDSYLLARVDDHNII